MTPDPDLTGPPEYQPDEEPGDDDRALYADAAADQADQEADPYCLCACANCSGCTGYTTVWPTDA